MTAPDTPAAIVRALAGKHRARGNEADARVADALDGVLAELAQARREPRVWLDDGEEIPQDVRVVDQDGEIHWPDEDDEPGTTSGMFGFGPLVEVHLPGRDEFWAAVAAEQKRRAASDRPESPQTPPGQCETDQRACGPRRGVQGRESASVDESHTVTEQWDAHGGDVVWRTCTCGEKWTDDVETCPEAP